MIPPSMCPTEDAVRVFSELLVDPLLPANASKHDNPSLLQQQKLAKQVHAVIILYNYYHRKQCPELEFLYFSQFCALAVLLRQALLAYMDFVKISDNGALSDPENQRSLTEKKIMDTCDICLRLDASKETPSIEGWPVSKVTVLLVDLRKENCWLEFGSVADGVWCMIEKNVHGTSQNTESAKRKRITKRPARDDSGVDDRALQHLAFSAVNEVAGIDMGDLSVLESHFVYSLSKEKSVSRFYIMQCHQPPNAKVTQMPIKDVLDRLQGPLITGSTNSWSVTSVVEYFPMLPCAGILSAWYSRGSSPDSSQNLKANLGTVKSEQTESEPKEIINRSHTGCIMECSGKKSFSVGTAQPKKSNGGNSNSIKNRSCDLSVVQDKDMDGFAWPTEDERIPGVTRVDLLQENKINHMNMDPIGHGNVSRQKESLQWNDEINAGGNCICRPTSIDDNRNPTEDCALVIHQGHSGALDKVQAVLASRENDLSQTALTILLKRRATLSLQLRKMEDEIALCDKDIQIIQNGDEDALAVKLEYVIDASCNAQVASLNCNNSQLSLYGKCECLSKVTPIEQDQCQELDDICTENKWTLPCYRVSPCNGGFIATVTVKCANFEISATGDRRHAPYNARESAAEQMLGKLREI